MNSGVPSGRAGVRALANGGGLRLCILLRGGLAILDRLLEGGDAAAGNTEHLEKLVVEGLALTPLVVGVLPFLGVPLVL